MWNTAETAEYLKSVTVGGEKQEPETEEAFASFITKRDSTSLEVEDGWYRWQVTIPADVLSERAADQKIGEITGIEVRRRSEGGAAETVLIEGEKGSMEIEGEYQIRKFLSAKGWPIQKNDGTVSCEMELLPSACFIVVPEKKGKRLSPLHFTAAATATASACHRTVRNIWRSRENRMRRFSAIFTRTSKSATAVPFFKKITENRFFVL